MGLRVQAQCRATLTAAIKNPSSVPFLRQAKFALRTQQVDNGIGVPTHGREDKVPAGSQTSCHSDVWRGDADVEIVQL